MSQKPPEKRLRLRRKENVERGTCKMNDATYKYLKISGKIEVVVAGKKKLELTASPTSDIPENEVWINVDEMKAAGLSDNSIATVRSARM
ncbi:MAG: hypothetical protein NO515_03480 [Candidatus Methanomethylicia archaeon]|uniref:Uncharacterized protein n=1 Tax=Thermoproteota archaeon TaxID=2056631 RepID=A0A523BCZ6_9CREN|nr:hypothetical protein [Candidatus Methanomethylicia archaeon]NHV61036.1 hypothetical protein [Candidatus Verstraetearchaeota archaeon]TDA38823.1 MAG: hypothetical protein DSO08_03520 [Candidatus Verstraetearchaeota archaeon]